MTEKNRLLMAKSDNEEGNLWLPLWMHLKDTAGVMKKLVHRWIPMSVIHASGLGFEEFEKTAVFLAAVHDIGKATSYFQSIITISNFLKRADMQDAGFTIRNSYAFAGKTPHSYAGQWILQSDVTNFGVDKSIADVVGAHHGKPENYPGINQEPDLIKVYEVNFFGTEDDPGKKEVWIETWSGIINEALKTANLDSVKNLPVLNIEAQVLLSGLLITADWIASNTAYFPLISENDAGKDDLYPKRINEGFARVSLPEGWRPETLKIDDTLFKERFGFLPNNVQRTMIQIAENCKTPGIFILEAQMGVGKTEAGLAAAELLASKCEAGGIFFGLPTQATSNGIFGRLYKWAESVSRDTLNSIRLAHEAAEFNEDYEQIVQESKSLVDDVEGEESGLEVHPWFQGNKKALLADFVIGTVDQFLMASLKRKHFMLRHLGLAGKIVIIDECHAYDTYMNEYLDRSLEWMAAYGVPVIILSATLPSSRRKELINCYVKAYSKYNLGKRKPQILSAESWQDNKAYPLLTWTDGEQICQMEIEDEAEEKEVALGRIESLEDTVKLLSNALSNGGCACIILNTVRFAQEVYDKVKSEIEDAQVLLYHAQFTMPNRAEKEQELLGHMGKDSNRESRNRFILIGTQVLEQSLDYDADIMISQLCPADLLMQRMGRLHRHKRERPISMEFPKFYILTNEGKIFDDGTEAVYGKYLLMKTWKELKEKRSLTLPEDIPSLVQRVYSEEEQENEDMSEAREEYDQVRKGKRRRAKGYLLSKPPKNMENILSDPDETVESAAESKVRDSSDSIEVLLMKKRKDGYITFVDENEDKINLDPAVCPGNQMGKAVARQRIKLPHVFSQRWNIQKTIDELEKMNIKELSEWQKSPWIKGDLILLLDENRVVQLNCIVLSYSKDKGLEYMIKEENDGGEGI